MGALFATAAFAAGPSALRKFQEGMSLAKQGKCGEAVLAFEEAQRIKPSSALLRRISECREKLGQLPEAKDALVKYLGDRSAPDREVVARELGRLEAKLEHQQTQAAIPAEVAVEPPAKVEEAAKPPPVAAVVTPEGVPTLDHRPLTTTVPGVPVPLRVRVNAVAGRSPVPAAYVRVAGISGFGKVTLEQDAVLPEVWTAKLPAQFSNEPFDYYLELLDEAGRPLARLGSSADPIKVTPVVLASPPAPVAMRESKTGPGGAARTFSVITATLAGAALLTGTVVSLNARSTLREYQDGQGPNQNQNVTAGQAESAVKNSQLGALVLGGGGLFLGLAIMAAY